jgi:glycerol kinase
MAVSLHDLKSVGAAILAGYLIGVWRECKTNLADHSAAKINSDPGLNDSIRTAIALEWWATHRHAVLLAVER